MRGAKGDMGDVGHMGERGDQGMPGDDVPDPGMVGSTYVRWGVDMCPDMDSVELVYEGKYKKPLLHAMKNDTPLTAF